MYEEPTITKLLPVYAAPDFTASEVVEGGGGSCGCQGSY